MEKEQCIFCEKEFDTILFYRKKPICDDCLDDLLGWATNGVSQKVVRELEKSVQDFIKQLWNPVGRKVKKSEN